MATAEQHSEQAAALLKDAERPQQDYQGQRGDLIAKAQVHALLAIREQLRILTSSA